MRNLKKKLDKGIIIFLPNNLSWIPRDLITSSNDLHLKISRFSSSRKRTRLTKRITFCVIIHKCNISRLNNISDPFQEFLSAIFLSKGRAGQRRWILNLPATFKFSLPDSSHTSPPPCPGKKEADIAEGWNVISSWRGVTEVSVPRWMELERGQKFFSLRSVKNLSFEIPSRTADYYRVENSR